MKDKKKLLLYAISILFAFYFLFENYPAFEALYRKMSPIETPYKKYNKEVLRVIRESAQSGLLDSAGFLEVAGPRHRSRAESLIIEMAKGSSSRNNFGTAMLALGLFTDYTKSGNVKNLDVLNLYINDIIDASGNFRDKLEIVDQCMIGYTLLGLYEVNGEQKLLNAIYQMNEFIMRKHIRTGGGLIPYKENQPSFLYVDTLGMICPYLSRYGQMFNSKECQNLAFQQLYDFYQNGVDKKTGLPFHVYQENQKIGIGLRGWARGVGWYCIGLIDTIAYLPKDSQQRNELTMVFRGIIDSVAKYQKENGCWSWEICNIDTRDDTSGTSMIAYSVARACEIGVIESTYYQMTKKALGGILDYTSKDGRVWSSLGICEGIGNYPQVFGHTSWGQGSTLALCALLQD